ncbi:beta-glucosidase family protein [Streptomyces sp. BI20]|uniref:beta-glucosidase family protein n=1 Tax=Streptomyces sp. BI20 TaxID=3403460 RepID=UPI003C78E185
MAEPLSRRSALRLLTAAGGVGLGGGAALGCAPAAGGLPAAGPSRSRPATRVDPAAAPGAARVDALLDRLTIEEKASLLHGASDPSRLGQAGYVPGVPRLGIPPLRLADGPAGVRVAKHATALPAPVLLAAAFDPALARRYGRVIGREGRALGQDVLLSPMCNLIRTPYAGRNFETFSEDPKLTADLVAELVRGIQDEGLIATVKHFALNNQEQGRETVDAIADERTLHETELRGFEAAVEAGAGAVMGAYNKVNGVHACESAPLLDELLRRGWGFDGWVMSDWNATHSTVAAITAGLDMEMPDGPHFGDPLLQAVKAGSVSEAAVDLAVRRILGTMDRFGLLAERPAARPARDPAAGAAVAREVAVAGATLLRNARATLPLTAADARSLAVIGPTAGTPFVSGGGSAHVIPDRAESPLKTLTARAGELAPGASVRYALGEDIHGKPLPAKLLTPPADLDDRGVDAGRTFTWSGTFTLPAADEWTLLVHYTGERPDVRLDDRPVFPTKPGVAEFFTGGLLGSAPDGLTVRRRTLPLTAGAHRLAVTAKGGQAGQRFRLRYVDRAGRAADLAAATAAAKAAHAVVLFAYEDATEGTDRVGLALPGGQNKLIEAVTAANPRTTVVLNTSSATAMPWLERTGAVLQMYYPGQAGAEATTEILFGDADPGGRLTQTFPAGEREHPTGAEPRRYPGVAGRQEYSEGVHVGYRWYAQSGVKPLFPFGHGLSYTTWAYENLSVRPERGGLRVEFTVRNTGRRAGVDVAQIYLGPSPDLRLEQPVRVLAGYRRLALRPGKSTRVVVDLDARVLSSWDPETKGRRLGTGAREVWVGRSATDLPLRAKAVVRPGPGEGNG